MMAPLTVFRNAESRSNIWDYAQLTCSQVTGTLTRAPHVGPQGIPGARKGEGHWQDLRQVSSYLWKHYPPAPGRPSAPGSEL